MSWKLFFVFCTPFSRLDYSMYPRFNNGYLLCNRLNLGGRARHIFADDEIGWLHIADLLYGPRLRI